jgi:iron(III) transport system ATP-binding protein
VLSVEHLTKSFRGRRGDGRVLAVDDVSLAIPEGRFFTMLGPSGCGKTTTLRCIAGLETPDAGKIALAGRVLFCSRRGIKAPANARGLGMVFQSYAIWPHMSVFDNVAFPLEVVPKRRRLPRAKLRRRVEEVLSVVKLDQLADRRATDLSGGQQQRLALARALVMEPPLLLLDEPLSNLDAKLREEMRFELKRLQRELGVTTIYVTHDQAEALAMSDTVAVMNDGRIEQLGGPRDIYERPRTRFVAGFVGTSNFIDGKVLKHNGDGRYLVETAHGSLGAAAQATFAAGSKVLVSARPEHIGVEPGAGEEGTNRWRGTVGNGAFLGDSVDHIVLVGDRELRVRCNPALSIPTGTEVTLVFREDACSLIAAAD